MSSVSATQRVRETQIIQTLCNKVLTVDDLLSRLQTNFPNTAWTVSQLESDLKKGASQGRYDMFGAGITGEVSYRVSNSMVSRNALTNSSFKPACSAVTNPLSTVRQAVQGLYQIVQNFVGGTALGLSQSIIDQLEKIGNLQISAEQWQYVSGMDQGLATTDLVTFNNVTTGTLTYGVLLPPVGLASYSFSGSHTFGLETPGFITLADFFPKTLELPALNSTDQYFFSVASVGSTSSLNDGAVLNNGIVADNDFVYIGGTFTGIGNVTRLNLARISKTAGLDLVWDPQTDGDVNSVAVDAASQLLYIGGIFADINGVTRNSIARIPTDSGSAGDPDSWNPNANGEVNIVVVDAANGHVYVGGNFTNIGGAARNRIARLSTSTGLADSWNPDADGVVNSIVLDLENSRVYVGGDFATIGGAARNAIARLSSSTGASDSWNPNANNAVSQIAVDETKVYVCGIFTSIGGAARNAIARLSTATGTADSWDPSANIAVNSIALDISRGHVYAGGTFTSIGGESRSNIARLSTTTGLADSWNPSILSNNVATTYLDSNNGALYIGGDFIGIESAPTVAGFLTLFDVQITSASVNTINGRSSVRLYSPFTRINVYQLSSTSWAADSVTSTAAV